MRKPRMYTDIMEEVEPSAGSVAKDRLKRAIQSERMKVSSDVMDMMQTDLKALIERYLGTTAEESDLVLEISKPRFVTPIMTSPPLMKQERELGQESDKVLY